MNLTNRTMSAAAWTFSSIIVQALLQIAVTSVLAHFIPPKEFGLYAIASLVIGMVGLFAQIGLGPTVVQRKELTAPFISGAYIISLVLGIFGFLLTWIASPWVAEFFKQPEVTGMLRATGSILIISGYTTIATALLQRELYFRKIAIINVASYAIGYGLIGCSMAILRVDAWAIVGASLTQNLIIAIMLLGTSGKLPKISASKREYKALLTFSAGVSLSQIFTNIASYIDNVIVGRFIGTTALGLYQMAFQIMDLPRRFLGNVIDQILFVVMTRIQDDQERMRMGYLLSLKMANLLLLPVTILMIIAAPEIVGVILGDKWEGTILPLQILLVQVPLRASVRMADSISTAAGKVYRLAWYKVLYTALIGVAALIGVRWGLTGVAVTVTVAVVVVCVIMVRFTLQIVNASIRDYLSTWVSALIIGFCIALSTFLSREVLRQWISAGMIRLVAIGLVAVAVLFVLVILRPELVGAEPIRMVLDFGKRMPLFSGVFCWMEKHVFAGKIPESI